MTELLTSAQMRAIEAAAIASGEVTGLELMERAGRGVVEAIFEEWPEFAAPAGALPRAPGYLDQDKGGVFRAVVLCGPGNNGGDGFVVARLLKELGGEVVVFLYGDPERMPPDARVNYERWRGMGEVKKLTGAEVDSAQRVPDLVVDAIFGTGLSRSIPWDLADAVQLYATTFLDGVRVVAVDIPSGLSSDSGYVFPVEAGPEEWRKWKKFAPCIVLEAKLCVTFHRPKAGHFLEEGPKWSGRLLVTDIGLSMSGADQISKPVTCLAGPTGQIGKDEGHKFSHGHALILSGPTGRGGAARLAARGALRIGAGGVTVGCPPDAMAENAARLDAIMLREVADAGAFALVLEDRRINALCLGPGMGAGAREVALLAEALQSQRPMVLDADALTILAREPEVFAALHGNCVLTPHAGEFARLFPDIAEKLAAPATKGPAYSKVDACRAAAARAGCVVLFKGPDTVIADPSGRCAINSAQYDRAAPWLATAGSGDVLAGFITGLLARGFDPFDAACMGAWLHVDCALEFGPGLIAEDLPEQLPAVFRRLLK